MLLRIKILRNRGFTLSQIKSNYLTGDVEATTELYREMIEECDKQLDKLSKEKETLLSDIERMHDNEERYVIRPAMYAMIYMNFESIMSEHKVQASLQHWLDVVSFGRTFFRYSRIDGEPSIEMGICVPEQEAIDMALDKMPGVVHIPAYPCSRKKITLEVNSGTNENWIGVLRENMDQFRVGDEPVYGNLIMSNREGEIGEYTYELMIPII